MKRYLLFSVWACLLTIGAVSALYSAPQKTTVKNLYGVKIDHQDSLILCRTLHFLAAPASNQTPGARVR